ncbi:MAG: hypothetical protein IIY38_02685, partial [Clostridia bacterium]|nr:hypothetical protein [Clostridia bacterium]
SALLLRPERKRADNQLVKACAAQQGVEWCARAHEFCRALGAEKLLNDISGFFISVFRLHKEVFKFHVRKRGYTKNIQEPRDVLRSGGRHTS